MLKKIVCWCSSIESTLASSGYCARDVEDKQEYDSAESRV